MSPTRRAAFAAALLVSVSPSGAMAQASKTATPIEHVIVIVGENHTFDNVFGAYLPRPGQTAMNLRSLNIIDDDGQPGRNFTLARQRTANSKGALIRRTPFSLSMRTLSPIWSTWSTILKGAGGRC